jgi:hypothetical protein
MQYVVAAAGRCSKTGPVYAQAKVFMDLSSSLFSVAHSTGGGAVHMMPASLAGDALNAACKAVGAERPSPSSNPHAMGRRVVEFMKFLDEVMG